MALTDRASLLRALFRLLDVDSSDPALTEHDDSESTLEGAYLLLEEGVDDAQDYLIQQGRASRWSKTVAFPDYDDDGSGWSTATGRDAEYRTLPDDFLRLAGDEEASALHYSDGRAWGRLIDFYDRDRAGGNIYWIEGDDQLWIADDADPPTDLQLDYIYRVPALADSTTVDFPAEDRPLIVAYAASHATAEAWVPNRSDVARRVERNLARRKRRAWKRARRSRQPNQMRRRRTIGTHHLL